MTDRETWLAQRRDCITATDVSKILGLAPWGSPHSVWRDKHGLTKDFPPTPAMRKGIQAEPLIVADYEERHPGIELTDPGRFEMIRNPDLPWIACTPDRVYADKSCGLECKLVENSWKYWSEDKPADHAFLQAHWCMIATGIPRWDIAAWVGNRYYEYNLEANGELHEALIAHCKAFFDRYIEGDEEPDLDGSPQTSAYLSDLFEHVSDEMLAPTAEVTTDAYRYREITKQEKSLKVEKERLRQKFAQQIGEATGFKGDDFVLTYNRAKPSQRIHTDGLIDSLKGVIDQQQITDLIQAHTTQTPGSRRISLKFMEDTDG